MLRPIIPALGLLAVLAGSPAPAYAQRAGCRDADLAARRVHYCVWGTGPVTVVFEAGLDGGMAVWDSIAPAVARFARVLTYDRAGYGRSSPGPAPRTPSAVADELRQLLQRIAARPPFVLVALGEGAYFARAFAVERPDSVAGLILVDSPHQDFESRRRAIGSLAERRALDSARIRLRAAMPPAARQELDGIDSVPPGDWGRAPRLSVPLVVLTATRHEWPPGVPREAQELLWRDAERELAQTSSLGEWTLVDAMGASGVLAQRATVAAAVGRVVSQVDVGRDSWLKRFDEWLGGFLSDLRNVRTFLLGLVTVIGVPLGLLYLQRRLKPATKPEPPAPADPHAVSLWKLVPKKSPAAGRAVRLLAACNQRARALYQARLGNRPAAEPEPETIWAQTWDAQDWRAQRSFIEPFNTGSGPQKYVATVIRAWLEDYAATAPADRDRCEIWLRASAGAGKSTVMTRLFFELIGATEPAGGSPPGAADPKRPAVPEPMLLQPRHLEASHQPGRIREASDPFATFIQYWLENRRIAVPEAARPGLIADFKAGLLRGDIVLLIDGHDDQRRMGLGPFLEDLRKTAHCWVAAERDDPDAPGSRGRREVKLSETWSLAEIRAHLERRWGPAHRHHRQIARIGKLLEAETDADHWLRIPRNLDVFLTQLEQDGVPDDETLKSLCQGQAELLRSIYGRAIDRLKDPTAVEHQISERLCRIAASQVLGAEKDLGPADDQDRVWHQVAKLGDIVQRTGIDGHELLRLRSPAFREFFLAGRIAFELGNPGVHGIASVTLVRDRWSRSLVANISDWLSELRQGPEQVRLLGRQARPCPPNLLNLLIRMELDTLRRRRTGVTEWELRREVGIAQCDFGGIELADADLRLYRFETCRFDGTSLVNADLKHAEFHDCSFIGANLAMADAVGAEFLRCKFLGDPSTDRLLVEGLQIESTVFGTPGDRDASDVSSDALRAQGATLTQSRYRGAFGRLFLNAQEAFLGPDLTTLETGAYRERIRQALRHAPGDRAVYLIDVMAGGGSERLASLLGQDDGSWPNLHVLGVDRDAPSLRALKREFPYRFEGRQWEIGPANGSPGEGPALDLDLSALLGEAFAGPGERLPADVIIAKKALHELPRSLQPALIRECHRALRPGGTFVLFADTPGGLDGSMREADFEWLDRTIRPRLRDPDSAVGAVAELVLARAFGDSIADQALFLNLWTLLKDWANDNVHEVEHRYFASAAEILGWAAEAGLEADVPTQGAYRLAVALFNETGIRHTMHHLERTGPDQADETALREWLTGVGQARFALLQEFTEHHLADGMPLARSLDARTDEICFDRVHPRLKSIRQRSRSFRFPVHVIGWRKPEPQPPIQEASPALIA